MRVFLFEWKVVCTCSGSYSSPGRLMIHCFRIAPSISIGDSSMKDHPAPTLAYVIG